MSKSWELFKQGSGINGRLPTIYRVNFQHSYNGDDKSNYGVFNYAHGQRWTRWCTLLEYQIQLNFFGFWQVC